MSRRRRTNSVKTEYGPQALFSYAVVDALLDIKHADRDSDEDGGRAFHRAVNHFLSLSAAETGYYSAAWIAWQRRTFKRPDGSPMQAGDVLTKDERRVEVAMAIKILRKRGILGWMDKPFSDDASEVAEFLGVDEELVEDTVLDLET